MRERGRFHLGLCRGRGRMGGGGKKREFPDDLLKAFLAENKCC
jgi:hypothetical protein